MFVSEGIELEQGVEMSFLDFIIMANLYKSTSCMCYNGMPPKKENSASIYGIMETYQD